MMLAVQVPAIKHSHYSALLLGVTYGAKCYSYPEPRVEEERWIVAKEEKRQDTWKHIETEVAEAQDNSILK
ncbi:ATP synthase subunit e, mitochondrial-like [Meles meles]|uniref:ATP synthase subunit e, mitochondrial-like n=1 Tax=Meles meles TaxID=9662 RepID=UPI001E6993A3|nr:ATP synthase subunit e, mitochondrial-like [Meles meles]